MIQMTCHSDYEQEIKKLVERAKQSDPKADGLFLGEKFFVELLHFYIEQYRNGKITKSDLISKKKDLVKDLTNHWDSKQLFSQACEIRNRQSHWFIKAEKEGCPICKKLVRIFDGRDKE